MKFWDSSALVPLLLEQPRSAQAKALLTDDADMVVWWGSMIECASAIARLHRDGQISADSESRSRAMLSELSKTWFEIQSGITVRDRAILLLRRHPLRAADAMQLSAALEWSGSDAEGVFVTFDDRLRDAAAREGFRTP